MNRRKKIKDIYDKRMKQANLKSNPKKAKPKYISKAERAKMEADANNQETISTDTPDAQSAQESTQH